jgi:hypothetical protein
MAKLGIKAFSLFVSALFAMVVVVGCNPEEPAPSAAPAGAPKAGPGPAAPGAGKAPAPSATPTAKDETKKP